MAKLRWDLGNRNELKTRQNVLVVVAIENSVAIRISSFSFWHKAVVATMFNTKKTEPGHRPWPKMTMWWWCDAHNFLQSDYGSTWAILMLPTPSRSILNQN